MPSCTRKLILFDIDGTLLKSHGGALKAMSAAARDVFGPDFDLTRVDRNGRLDQDIISEAVVVNGASATAGDFERFRGLYLDYLREEAGAVRALPGVGERLDELGRHPGVMLGLATGNYTQAAWIKLAAAGIAADPFVANGFAEDATTRSGLIRHAAAAARGANLSLGDVLVVGDTPRDVEAARDAGCRCLAVATGNYSREILQAAGAHTVLHDLTDPQPFRDFVKR